MSQQLFVTLQEARRVNAVKHNRPRELNQTEQLILAGIELSKKPKYDIEELKDLCKLMLDTTGGERLADKLKEAVNDPVAMKSLVEVYPHVEFYDAIKEGPDAFNPFERLHYTNQPFEVLQSKAATLVEFLALLEQLPKGVDTYIYTPWTNVHALRAHWDGDKKQTRCLGYALPAELQKAITSTLQGRWQESVVGSIIADGLFNNKNLWVRARVSEPKSDFVLSYHEDPKFSTYGDRGRIVKATNKKTNSTYHFCV